MKKMIRRLRPMLSAAVILCAFAGASLGDTLAAPKSQESGGAEREGRHQDELTFTQIDFPGATITLANAISNRDQIVGIYIDVSGAQHGFLLDDGFAPLDFPGADGTAPIGINDRGQIVGLFGDAGGAEHGFLLDNGTFTQIDFPRGVDTNPNSISNRGQIVGHVGPVGAFHGFLFNDGAFTQIDVPDALETAAIGINNRGRITGYFRDRGDLFHGFLLNNGVFTQIDFPDAPQTQAYGINDRGEIVGIFGEAVEQAHGFLLSDGVYTQIDFPEAAATIPSGINNRGQIVGDFVDSTSVAHGFLATKEQFSGKASGVGSGEENAAVEIAGTFTSPTDLDLCAATLTITSLLNEQAGSGELVARAAPRSDGCSGKPPQPRVVHRPFAPEHRFGHDPGRRVGQVHLQDQSQRRDHQLSPELFADSTHDQLPSRRLEQAADHRQHGAVVVLLRPVEQVSQDSLSEFFLQKERRRRKHHEQNDSKRLLRRWAQRLFYARSLSPSRRQSAALTPRIRRRRSIGERRQGRQGCWPQGTWFCAGQQWRLHHHRCAARRRVHRSLRH